MIDRTGGTVDAVLRATADRYAALGRWKAGFAKGKLLGDPVYAELLPWLDGPGALVDVGCGEGYLLVLARQIDPARPMIGIDHDPRRIDDARRVLRDDDHVDLRLGDALDAEVPPARCIACVDVLHYEPPERQDRLLAGLAAALEDDGCLLVRDVERARGWRTLVTVVCERIAMMVGRHRGQGIFVRRADEIEAALERHGLHVERIECQRGTPFANTLFVARKIGGRS